MNRQATVLPAVTLAIGLFVSTIAQVSVPQGAGKDWLSWSPEERSVFAEAYKAGYVSGKSDACEAAARLFEPHERVTDFSRSASARCLQHAKAHSKTIDHYTEVITTFYSKYAKYEGIPYAYLMLLLTDDRYNTADEIYQAALKGEIRTNF